jgi:hypothetical protein
VLHDDLPPGSLRLPPAPRIGPLQLAPVRMYFFLKA